MGRRGFYPQKNRIIFRAVCLLISVLIGVLLADAKLRPAIFELAAAEARSEAARRINSAVEGILMKEGMAYGDIVAVSRGESGAVTGITTDIVKMNLFKSKVTNAVERSFSADEILEVTVPLGSATEIALFSGWGPYLKVKMRAVAVTESDFDNVFETAGINQTQHSVMLSLSTKIVLTLSGRRITETLETSFCVAQTVIVGTVPDYYRNSH